jgi:hypothetical protein
MREYQTEVTVMSYGGGVAAGITAAVIADAIKASGAIVRVENSDFLTIIKRAEKPLVVIKQKSFWSPNYKYISSYKGLAFFTKSAEPLRLPSDIELIMAKSISIPG